MGHDDAGNLEAQWQATYRSGRNAVTAWAVLLTVVIALASPLAPWLPGPEVDRELSARVVRIEPSARDQIAWVAALDRPGNRAIGYRWRLDEDDDVTVGATRMVTVSEQGETYHGTTVPGGPAVAFPVMFLVVLIGYGLWRLVRLAVIRRDLERPQRLGRVWVAVVDNPVHRSVHEAVLVWFDDPTTGGGPLPRPDAYRLADLSEDEHADSLSRPAVHEAWTPVGADGAPTRGRWFATRSNLVLTVRRPWAFTRWALRRGLGSSGDTTSCSPPPRPTTSVDTRVGWTGWPRAVVWRAVAVVALGALGTFVGGGARPIPADVLQEAQPIRQVTAPPSGLETVTAERALGTLPLARIAADEAPTSSLLQALDFVEVRVEASRSHQVVRFDMSTPADAGALLAYLALAHRGDLEDRGGWVLESNFGFEVLADGRPERVWWAVASEETTARELVDALEPVTTAAQPLARPGPSVTVRGRTTR